MITARSIVPSLLLLCSSSACGDDSGGSGSEGSTSAATTSSTTQTDSTTTPPDDTSGSMSGSSSSTGEPGSTGPEPTSEGDSTTVGIDPMGLSFFATSVGSGDVGGNLGGLEGADAMCQGLAQAVGEGARTWHAYLSTSAVDARDRIGSGPWYNAAGEQVAADVAALHADGLSNADPQHILDENGSEVPGNEHDILTGSQEDGTLLEGSTCADWTSNAGGEQARVGHSDIPMNPMFSPSWNSAHDAPGCGPGDLAGVGGAGRLYCFAID